MTLWRARRRLLTLMYFICCLSLAPGYLLIIWSVSDGPAVLSALGFHADVPSLRLDDAGFLLVFLGASTAFLQTYRMIYDMREQAISGDQDAIPPAKPLPKIASSALGLPITLAWRRTRGSWLRLAIGFSISLAASLGLVAFVAQLGLFSFLFSLQAFDFWLMLSMVAVGSALLAALPLTLLILLTRDSRGIVADAYGVSAWRKYGSRDTIAWADARLLEIWGRRGKRGNATTRRYTLYALDGRSVTWHSHAPGSRSTRSHVLLQSEVNDSEERAAAVLELARAHAGLTPRSFFEGSVEWSSNLAAPGNVMLSKESLNGLNTANLVLLLGATAGCGIAALAGVSPFGIVVPLLGVAMLTCSTSWSLIEHLRDALRKPIRLRPEQRPNWQAAQALRSERPTQLAQARSLAQNWALGVRSALLVGGCALCLAAFISELAVGKSVPDRFTLWYSIIWLSLALCFAVLRVASQFKRMRICLEADESGILNHLQAGGKRTPWAGIVSLRFTWSRAQGFLYTAQSRHGDLYTWASQSREWYDEVVSDLTIADSLIVDGDTFAAVVAAQTGLVPAQTF